MATVRGTVRPIAFFPAIDPFEGATVRLVPVEGTDPSIDAKVVSQSRFEFLDVPPGWYIVLFAVEGFVETVDAIHVVDGANEVRPMGVRLDQCSESPSISCESPVKPAPDKDARGCPIPVVTVREALEGGLGGPCHGRVVVVGIFKSGMDETLRLDCPFQLVTGEVGWPSSIGLNAPSQAPDELREKVEKKRAEVLESGPRGAQPRPERVVALYGIFVSLAGLGSAPCCSAAVETALPPARLFGVAEKDLRVIR